VPKVLVIDGDRSFRDDLAKLLGGAGYTVITKADGSRIEALVAAEKIDAIVTGLYMPDVDGIEVVGRVRAQAPHIPIIGTGDRASGEDDPCSRAMVLYGAIDVLPKPIDGDRLLTTLGGAIARGDGDP
jgi:DNA-binding NtrC family response regulator